MQLKNKVVFVTGGARGIGSACAMAVLERGAKAFSKAVEAFGNVDVMINNAGMVNEVEWERSLDVNLKGVIRGTETAIAHMRKDKGGRGGVIINMASVTGYHPYFSIPVYVASKHAVIGYTRSLANAPDVTTQDIRYACVCPDCTDTPILDIVRASCRQEYIDTIKVPDELIPPSKVSLAVVTLLEDDGSNDVLLEVSAKGMIRRKLIVGTA